MNNGFAYYVQDYTSNYIVKVRNLSTNTIKSYNYVLLDFIRYLKSININVEIINIDDIKLQYIEGYIVYLRDKNNKSITINTKINVLKSFFEYAQKKSSQVFYISSQVMQIRKLREETKIQEFFTEEELQLIFEAASVGANKNLKHLCMLMLLYSCALRASELCNLKVEDIYLNRSNPSVLIKNGKGNKSRIVIIDSQQVIKLLKCYIQNENKQINDYLFLNKYKQPYTRQGIKYILKKYWELAKSKNTDNTLFNIPPHPHMMRHSKGVHLAEAGINLILIRDFMGHSSIKTTEIYARISTKKKEEILKNNAKEKPLKYKRTKIEKKQLDAYLLENIKNI